MPHNPLIPAPDQAPFALPLSREAFRHALRRGLGRAWLHARDFGLGDRLEDVVYGAVNNLSLNAQAEGCRAAWMLTLIDAADALDEIRPLLFDAMDRPASDEEIDGHGFNVTEHLEQRANLASMGAMPTWVREEAAHDASATVRTQVTG